MMDYLVVTHVQPQGPLYTPSPPLPSQIAALFEVIVCTLFLEF